MKRILVENIGDGMLLAKEVLGPSGNVLLNKGTAVNAAMGRRLKNWGILFVYVEGEEELQTAQAVAQLSPDQILALLENKFSAVINNPIMKKIFAAVYNYKLNKGPR
ncbi:MAG: hypothetical protein PHC61_14215 [Chitinivibrionales bacterium]|nr:hypothetical protein [Chitinivibrionales bacterium]